MRQNFRSMKDILVQTSVGYVRGYHGFSSVMLILSPFVSTQVWNLSVSSVSATIFDQVTRENNNFLLEGILVEVALLQ